MDEFDIEVLADPELSDPILVEGLPGVGHVGKLAAEYLVEQLDSELVRRVYTEHFPPQVNLEDGIAELTCAEFHAIEGEEHDLLVLTGDHQAQDNAGHYRLTNAFLDVAESFDVSKIIALGGVPTGELIEEYAVLGAATNEDLVAELEDLGVEFREDEPAGGIVGVSGLMLGLGRRRGIPAACLMGETSGYLVDPKSAQAVLKVLEAVLSVELDYEDLEERADEMEDVMGKIKEMEQSAAPTDEDLRYIG
ncbi:MULTISPECIES: proteasome assembly chaperone family protein [unclassified Haladaptatus]|uniref:proteasome assembly chaperone family protein n=1 Tax=unclassified Haladaptatus TaxID=2622732 RepID=UPI0023E89B4A|nr:MULTISPECIES: proteasome assembly chaperone family protein [unclassified Haladaptatus]